MSGARLVWIALMLAGCGGGENTAAPGSPPDLERAAIERGVIRDPASTDLTGLYARETDRLCIVRQGYGYRIGISSDYGNEIFCSGRGTVSRSGETLQIELGQGCSFDARYDGDRIRLPGRVPAACQALCERRVSLAGMEVTRLSDSVTEARAMRDPRGHELCAAN